MNQFLQSSLPNGLTVLGEHRASARSVALGFFVKTGARDENSDISGVSHFLEHMMFKGSARRSALELTYELGAIGAQANAFTAEENTVYYLSVLPEYQRRAFDLLAGDIMRPAITQEEFDVEKKVILEEIALYQDRPTHVLLEATLREFFHEHPAGNSVLGTTNSVGNLPREAMIDYYKRRYSPSNMVLSVTGNFVWDEVLEDANRYCADWEATQVSRQHPPHTSRRSSTKLYRENLQCAHVCIATPGPSVNDPNRYALAVLCTILGDHSGSRTYWELVDKGLADSASVDTEEMDGIGMVYAYGSAFPDNIEKVTDILCAILKDGASFTEDELSRAKTKIATRLVLQGESTLRRLMAVGLEWIYRNEYTALEEELRRLKAVTADDIKAALEVFSLQPKTIVTMIPEEE